MLDFIKTKLSSVRNTVNRMRKKSYKLRENICKTDIS